MSFSKIAVCFLVLLSLAFSAFAAGEKDYKELYRQGVEYNKMGNFDKAIELYTKAVALKPDSAPLFFVRGRAYLANRQIDNAIADLSKAVTLKPDYADAYNVRGVAYAAKKQDQLAAADFKKACSQGLKEACKNVKN